MAFVYAIRMFCDRCSRALNRFRGNDYRSDKVDKKASAGAGHDGPDQAYNGGVNVKIFPDASAYAAEHFVGIRTV